MSDKLNQSLDQIMGERRKSQRRVRKAGPTVKVAPVGGVSKKTRQPEKKAAAKPIVPTRPAGKESKVVVSNLPRDVTEAQIKDYFTTSVGATKRVLLTYGPDGRSRGIATIIFARGDFAAKAAKELNGLKVDGRPMKIEVIVDARAIPEPVAPKSLGDRVEKKKGSEKTKPKSAAAAKPTTADKAGKQAGRGRGGRPAKGGRPKPKTAEELDAEMADYFTTGTNGNEATTNGGAVQAATNGDVGMEDEVA